MISLIHKIQTGDKDTFKKVYLEYFDVLYNLCVQYIRNERVAEEIVQDSFTKLWEIRQTLDDETNLRNFLYTITKNKALNYLRNQQTILKYQKNAKYLEMQFNYESLGKLGDTALQFEELKDMVNTAIDNLPEDIKKAFLLSRFQDKKYREIADELNVSQKTVEVRISKALTILRKELKEYLPLIYLISGILS